MAAVKDFVTAMQKLYIEGAGTDITLVCQGSRKAAHAAVLMARSPFFRAKVERWTNEKREIVLDGCDPEVLAVVLDYMYGIDLPKLAGDDWTCSACHALNLDHKLMCGACGRAKDGLEAPSDSEYFLINLLAESGDEGIEGALSSTTCAEADQMDCFKLCKVLEVSELFLMADLKAEVEKISIKIISKNNVKELCRGADDYGCKKLARACADFMVKNGICLDGEEVKQMPDVTAACMMAYREELEASKKELEASKKALTISKMELATRPAYMRQRHM